MMMHVLKRCCTLSCCNPLLTPITQNECCVSDKPKSNIAKGRESYEIPGCSDDVLDEIPTDIDEMFCISENMANEESERENEDDDE